MSKQALITLATRHQVFLERLKTQTAVDFASVLPKISDAIAQIASALEVARIAELGRVALRSLLKDLRDKQAELIAGAQEKLLQNLRDISSYEADFEERMLGGIFNTAGSGTLVEIGAGAAWKASLGNPLSATGQLLEPFVQGWGVKQIEGVDRAVMRAWGEGRTVSQLMRDIRGTKALNYKDGLVDVSRRQAEAVARTAVQHVSQQSREATWEANSDIVEGYQFVATLDGRTTSQCRSLDGKKFGVKEGPRPPLHVNCRSTTIPILPKEFDFLDEGATRASKDGYVPANQSYYEWLKTQPESFQNEVLGASRAKLFREGGLSAEKFAALNLGKNFEPLSLAEMQAKEPALFEKTGIKVKGAAPSAPRPFAGADIAAPSAPRPFAGADIVVPDDEQKTFENYRRVTGGQKSLPDEDSPEYRALDDYKGGGYREINGYLRTGSTKSSTSPASELQKKVAALDGLMSGSNLAEDAVLYRGFKPPQGFDFDGMRDFVFEDKGFVSTSVDKRIAGGDFASGRGGVLFKIRARKDTKAIAVESRLGLGADGYGEGSETEVLLPRGTVFRFTGSVSEETVTVGGTKATIKVYEVDIEEN